MELVSSIILGFVFGILASWAFWKYLLWQRPKVNIAPKISVEKDSRTGRKMYRFKIFNHGNNQAIDITLKAWVCDLMEIPGGQVSHGLFQFPIENSNTRALGSKSQDFSPWEINPSAIYTSIPDFDVEELLMKPNHKIMLVLRVSDALSGTTLVQQKTYVLDDIVTGIFSIGEEMSVVEKVV